MQESPAGTHLWLRPVTDVAEVLGCCWQAGFVWPGMTCRRCLSHLTWTVAMEDQVCSILWWITSPIEGMPDFYSNRFVFKSFQISRWCCICKLSATWWTQVLERTSTVSVRMPPESPLKQWHHLVWKRYYLGVQDVAARHKASLHSLPVHFRTHFKMLLFVFKPLNVLVPQYTPDLLHLYTASRLLRSADQLLLVMSKTIRGDRTFSVAALKL